MSRWSVEWLVLAKAYRQISEEPIRGTGISGDVFWEEIAEIYNSSPENDQQKPRSVASSLVEDTDGRHYFPDARCSSQKDENLRNFSGPRH